MDLSPTAYAGHLRTIMAKSTASKYREGARLLLEYCEVHGVDMQKAPPGMLQGFITWLSSARNLAPASVGVMHSGATRYVDWRRKCGEPIPHFDRPELPPVPTKEPERLTAPELTAFLHSATATVPEPCCMALVLLPYCGLRSSEHVALKLSDVLVDVVDSKRVVTLRVQHGKGNKFRYVPVLEAVYPRLGHYLSHWRAGQVSSPWLFPSKKNPGAHVGDKYMRDWMVHVRRDAGLNPNVTPHTLRRTYASTLRQQGYSETTIADILGHESVDTTRKHYFAIASPEDLWKRLREQQTRPQNQQR